MKNFIYKVITISIIVFTLTLTSLFTFKEQTTTVNATEGNTPKIEIYKYNVSYSSEIYIAYAVSYEDININNSKIQMLFWNSIQDEYVKGTESYIETSKGISSIGNVNCSVYYSRGLAAKEMTTDVYARAYVKIDDKEYYSEVTKFSVLEYIEKMRDENSTTSGQSKLFDTMLQYGGAAQNNFNYKTDRPADGKYYGVDIHDGYLPDGFNHGRYLEGEKVLIKANHKDGMKFAYWTDANGIIISYDKEFEININIKIDFTAHFKDIDISSQLAMSKEVTYDTTSDKLELPDAVAFEDEDSSVTLDITWDTTKFTANKIGTQRLYATLKDEAMYEKYHIKTTDIYMDITVLPYTYSLDSSTNKYMITGYYGTDEKVTIPTSYNNTLITTIKAKAFNEVTTLKEVVIPNTIEKIELAAFYNCDNIESITIPFTGESKSSSNSWFAYIFGANTRSIQKEMLPSKLVTVILNEGMTSIHDYAFENCSSLTSIELPSSVTSIGSSAFSDCSSLTSIVIPEGVTSIGSGAFSSCSSLTSIVIPEGVTIIGSGAFSSCSSLTSIVIPEGVTIINGGTFRNCSSLTSIELPSKITNIGWGAFDGCVNLVEVILPKELVKIDEYVFNDCSSLQQIILPSNVKTIGSYVFSGCSSLTSVEIPLGVTSIGSSAFRNCSSLTSIVIPSNVISIGSGAFSSCSSLTSIVIPEGVTSIGSSAFFGCSSLTSIEIPLGVTSIENGTFSSCSSLTSIVIPSSVTSVGSSAFSGCSSLTSIVIPEGVTSIGYDAFSSCSSLTNVYYDGTIEDWCNITFVNYSSNPMHYAKHFYMKDSNNEYKEVTEIEIPDTITSISDYRFYNFTALKSITLPSTITSIGSSAFYNCGCLVSIVLPLSLTSIGNYAFFYCNSLTSIEIPSSLTSIGYDIFDYYFNNLENVYYDGTIEDWCNISFSSLSSNPMYYAKHFYMKDSNNEYKEVTEIEIPDTITSISDYRFYNFTALKSITIPSSVTSIGSYAFYKCSSLISVKIPSSVTSIGDYAFYGCSSLTIYCEVESAPSGWNSSWNYSNCPVVWGYKEEN